MNTDRMLVEIYNPDGTKDVVHTAIALRRTADAYDRMATEPAHSKHAHALRLSAAHCRSEAERLEPELDIPERRCLGSF